ncbi:MAG TPA: gamma-aminobutyraldehyde dehydrogenase [Terriglobales bacterium]|nr:gamma-aminobutyraldehyde dehydrogenase [Terriglobales bacterium]
MTALQMFINGEWLSSSDGVTEPVLNPATEETIASVPLATAQDVDRAVASAKAAFPRWAETPPAARSRVLLRLADRIEACAETLAQLESRNVGKPLEVARDDVEFSVDNLRFFAGAARSMEGRASGEYLTGHTSMIRREPLGVVASIAPWNYPLLMAVWKIGPALAVGNTVVLKPSELTPLTSLKLAEFSADLLPPGVLNVVTGHGDSAGAALVAHPDVALVSLTGDTSTGRNVLQAAAPTLKKVHLELGGKAPALVFEDADLAWTAQRLRRSGFYNSGQDCTAVTRILVHKHAADPLLHLLTAEMKQIRVGNPAAPDTNMGPLISRAQQERVADMVHRARAAGGEILAGGEPPRGPGFFFPPTLVRGVNQADEIIQKEVFGPVLTWQTFSTESEALEMANGVAYGLTASIWTQDVSRAIRLSQKLQFGTVWINNHTRLTPEMPHGGVKHSGHSKDMSSYALEEYTQIKHVMVRN